MIFLSFVNFFEFFYSLFREFLETILEVVLVLTKIKIHHLLLKNHLKSN